MTEPCEEAIALAREIGPGFRFKTEAGVEYYDARTTALAQKIQDVIDKAKEQANG